MAQQPQQQPGPPPPNQAALGEARDHAKAGRVAEAIAALERVTPPAGAVLNQLRTSDDFKALRDNPRFQAIVAKLTPCAGPQYKEFDFWLGEWEVRNAGGQLLGRNHRRLLQEENALTDDPHGVGPSPGRDDAANDRKILRSSPAPTLLSAL